ncbi:STAS/SEC14 domain-containing protein [Mucilaginibacter sp. JRF]|uniref:STAS/SEC14 domain-containing protein n=1 Tax=Mucilaginibacter sp. JRF TaxID=2780088 RepID=UPI0018812C2E|nr:STAS/SEC14 domain-containing protein [Mucilaginibacter sp. JRF]MBE9583817.1 STAS/SEC14 domain-containing protein [Mucilaginibacter sp. JRF]
MLSVIDELPGHVVGIHTVGRITGKDIKNTLEPLLNSMAGTQQEVNYLLLAESGLADFTVGAMLAYSMLIIKYYARWNKVAVVTDDNMIRSITRFFRFLIPGISRQFNLNEMDKAIQWIARKDIKLNTYDD